MTHAAPAAVLSFVTTLHVAAFLLLAHRSAGPGRRALLLPSVAFAVCVWLLPAPAWLLAGLAAHAAWLAASERLVGPVREEEAPATPAKREKPGAPAPPPPARGDGFHTVRVLSVLDETPEIRTFRLERPRDFAFRAGQFLVVRVPAGGAEKVRCYSISSSPETTGYLEISVRRQGLVSGALHETVRVGATLRVRGPGGDFVYPEEGGVPLVLHAGGVGVTPLISMLRHAAWAEPGRLVTFLYSVRTEADVAFRDELAVLARRAPGVKVLVTLSRGEPKPGFLTGRMDAQRIARYVPNPGAAIHLICGPGPMIEGAREALQSLGVPPEGIRFEAFEAAVAAASAPAAGDAERELRLERSGITTRLSGATTLLEAAEAACGAIDSMCRAGTCGTCRTKLLSGRVEDSGKALSPAERKEGWVLACVSRPVEDCVLDA